MPEPTPVVVNIPVDKQLFFALMDKFDIPSKHLPPGDPGVVEMDCELCNNAVEISEFQLKFMKAHPSTPVRCFVCELIVLNTADDVQSLMMEEVIIFPDPSSYEIVLAGTVR